MKQGRNQSPDDLENLGEAIRRDAPLFLETATKAFRELFAKEYARLRGYAFESAQNTITLALQVECTFDGDGRGVALTSCPQVAPAPLVAGGRIL